MNKLLFILAFGVICSFSHAEIVKNSKGEKIELKPNGTWVKVKNSSSEKDRILSSGDSVSIDVKDGNDNIMPITVHIRVDGEPAKKVTLNELSSWVDFTGFSTKLKLKNKYSFIPRSAMATVKEDGMEIFMEYTAKNSYGADVVGYERVKLIINEEGKYTVAR